MIPTVQPFTDALGSVDLPSLTYRLDHYSKRIEGKIDGKEAITQAIDKMLVTERFAYLIYGPQYGVELEGLIGQDKNFVFAVIKERLSDSFKADNRIYDISDFEITEQGKEHIHVRLSINTVYGEVQYSGVML